MSLLLLPLLLALGQPPATWGGTVVRAGDGAPVAGALISVLDSAGSHVVATAVTGARGTFRVALASVEARVRVRVLRIGQRPFLAGPFDPTASAAVRLSVPQQPVALRPVLTRADARCVAARDGGALLAELLGDIRTALELSRRRADNERSLARFRTYTEVRDLDGRVTERVAEVVEEGESSRPFTSVSLDSLVRDGYVVPDGDGAVYRAPDAEVLLSDAFLEGHCFRVTEGQGSDSAQVGVAFAPRGRLGGRVEVEGTLWLDAASRTLERLDYRYVGLSPVLVRTPQGGRLEFSRLADGLVLVSRWEIRMPRLTVVRRIDLGSLRGRSTMQQPHVATMQVTGGEVVGMQRGGRVQLGTWAPGAPVRRVAGGVAGYARTDSSGMPTAVLLPEQLAARPSARVSDLVTAWPGLRVGRTPDGVRYLLGAGGCPLHVVLDGGEVLPAADAVVPIDALVPRSTLLAVEYFATAAQIPERWRTELSPRAVPCGAMALWTAG